MVAEPVFPNLSSRFAVHFSQTSFLIPITREFQDSLLISSRKTAGCNDFLVHATKRQVRINGNANTCPFGCWGLAPRAPFVEESLDEFADARRLLPLIEEAQIQSSELP
jgi:hypothetical protein